MKYAFWACVEINNFGDVVPFWYFNQIGSRLTWHNGTKDESGATDFSVTVHGYSGSIMSMCRENFIVSGCGFMDGFDTWFGIPKKIISVRGELTRQRAIELGADCPAVFDDICSVLPAFIKPAEKVVGRVGFVRHYADREYIRPDGMVEIDICAGVERVVSEVTACEKIYSQSLHGIVLADVYGIPVERVPCSLLTDWKFDDYESGARRVICENRKK